MLDIEQSSMCLVLCSAVGIQMKLEFFQRKFWTACRQVTKEQLI